MPRGGKAGGSRPFPLLLPPLPLLTPNGCPDPESMKLKTTMAAGFSNLEFIGIWGLPRNDK